MILPPRLFDQADVPPPESALREAGRALPSPSADAVRALAEHLPIGLYQSTPDGRVLFANEALAHVLGVPSREALARLDLRSDFGYPREHFEEQLRRHGEVRNLVVRWTDRTGRTKYTRENARAVRDAAGTVRYYEGTMEDVTAEHEAREREHRRVEQLGAIVRFATAVDRAATLDEVHRAAVEAVAASMGTRYAILLVRRGEATRCVAWTEALPDDAVALFNDLRLGALLPLHAAPILLRDEQASGRVLLPEAVRAAMRAHGVRAAGSFPLVHHGRAQGAFVVLYEDPHTFSDEELRVAETLAWHVAGSLARHRAESSLRDSEACLRFLAEHTAQVLYRLRYGAGPAHGRFDYLSPAIEALTGYTPEALDALGGLGALVEEREVLHGEGLLERAPEEAGEHRYLARYRMRTKDDETVWVEDLAYPWYDGAGRPVGVVGVLQDVTERKAFERELIAAREAAEEVARLKSAFLANMSHEIRTPLTGILGYAGILAEEVEGEHREFAAFIERSGRRLLDTLNSVLELARLEANGVEPSFEWLDVTAEAQQAVRLLTPLAEAKGIALALEAPAAAAAHLDRVCLGRILTNLIGNAIKFTDEGGVTVGVEADEAAIRVGVRDTGCGIGAAFLPRLFDEFKQESEGHARSHEGAGLGLAITKRLTDLLGGTIAVESRRPGGTAFTVTFPRRAAAEPPMPGGEQNGSAGPVEALRPYVRHELSLHAASQPGGDGAEAPVAAGCVVEGVAGAEGGPALPRRPAMVVSGAASADAPAPPGAAPHPPEPMTDAQNPTLNPTVLVPRATEPGADPAPDAPDADVPDAVNPGPQAAADVAPTASRPSVLVVEDNEDTRMLLDRILRRSYRVVAVADALTALDRMNRERFDALVLDINLGGRQTGVDVLRVARTLPGYGGIFAVALTAYALPGDRERFLEAGFNRYVSKPFTRATLMAALEEGAPAT